MTELTELALIARGKVRELYRLGRGRRAPADGGERPDLDLRRRHPTEIPDKGKVLAGLSAILV